MIIPFLTTMIFPLTFVTLYERIHQVLNDPSVDAFLKSISKSPSSLKDDQAFLFNHIHSWFWCKVDQLIEHLSIFALILKSFTLILQPLFITFQVTLKFSIISPLRFVSCVQSPFIFILPRIIKFLQPLGLRWFWFYPICLSSLIKVSLRIHSRQVV